MNGVLTQSGIDARDAYENNSTDKIKYGNRYVTEYSTDRDSSGNYIRCKNYPVIYGLELDSIINGEPTGGTLGSSSQISFIERLDANLVAVAERVTNAISIRPKQTYYNLGTSFDSTYRSYFKTYEDNGTKSYLDLISPKGSRTRYWIASRCINLYNDYCGLHIQNIYSGRLSSVGMCGSYYGAYANSYELFPVASLSSELISPDGTNFKVEL